MKRFLRCKVVAWPTETAAPMRPRKSKVKGETFEAQIEDELDMRDYEFGFDLEKIPGEIESLRKKMAGLNVQ